MEDYQFRHDYEPYHVLQVISSSTDYISYLLLSVKPAQVAVVHRTHTHRKCLAKDFFDAVPFASLNAKNLDIWPTLVDGTSVAGSISEAGVLEVLLAFPTPVSSSGSGHAGSHISSSGFSKRPRPTVDLVGLPTRGFRAGTGLLLFGQHCWRTAWRSIRPLFQPRCKMGLHAHSTGVLVTMMTSCDANKKNLRHARVLVISFCVSIFYGMV